MERYVNEYVGQWNKIKNWRVTKCVTDVLPFVFFTMALMHHGWNWSQPLPWRSTTNVMLPKPLLLRERDFLLTFINVRIRWIILNKQENYNSAIFSYVLVWPKKNDVQLIPICAKLSILHNWRVCRK